ncbi:MAG: hypothetical protein L0Y67_03245, partial [Gammaproteobacteria bacterium]|nr:hypothetical protein [Gammaproteobacteria bacterium]
MKTEYYTVIDPATLAKDIETCFNLTSADITPAMIQRQIDRLKREGAEITDEIRPTKALAELIARNLTFLNSDKCEALVACEIYVVPLPLCMAYSKAPNSIIVGNGLINLISACGYWGNFVETLPLSLDEIKPFAQFPKTSVLDAVSTFLFALMYRHYQYGEALPDFRVLTADQSGNFPDRAVKDAVAGAATFILLHELGHLRLNHHIEDKQIMPIDVPLAVPQALSSYQRKELEADDFAMKAIQERLRPLHVAWINMALNFHLLRETLLAERSNRHPININRLAYANARSAGQIITPVYYAEHLEKMGKSFTNIERNTEAILENNQT